MRPSRVAAAAAAAMPPWLTPRDARAVGIPGMDSPGGTAQRLISYTEVKLYRNAGLGNEKVKKRREYRWSADLQSAGWRRLVGMHERHHKERPRLYLEQLQQDDIRRHARFSVKSR